MIETIVCRTKALSGLLVLFVVGTATGRAEETADAERREFFESRIRPLLVEHCYACHSGEDVEANLRLDTRQGWQAGGDSGAAIAPGDPDGSLLIDAVRYTEDVIPGMPPDSKLPAEDIAALERWVADGADDPRDADPEEEAASAGGFDLQARQESHWCWRPIRRPEPPQVEHSDWPRAPLDRFVLAKLEAEGLQPAADADQATWLRRVTFDLTGLPPTPEQIQAFLQDSSPRAKRQVVDRLLESVQFGEAWARHWLDLVRYADSHGHEFDYKIDHAYEYRDYVIRALNADVPYDQLVREHIAGDLIENPRRHPSQGFNESVIGTGFWFLHEATHAPTDVQQNEADIASNQIDVFGKAFLGLTVACARCHDHKFDAISTADYYGLFAHLKSSGLQRYPLDPGGANASLAEENRRVRERISERLGSTALDEQPPFSDSFRQRYAALEAQRQQQHQAWQGSRQRWPLWADFRSGELPSGWRTNGPAFVAVGDDLGFSVSPGQRAHRPATIDSGVVGSAAVGNLRSPSFEITAPQIHVRVRSDADMLIRVVINNYQLATRQPLLFKGTLLKGNQTDTGGEFRWLTLAGDLKKYVGHRAYLEFVDRGEGSLAVDQIRFSQQPAPADEMPPAEKLPPLPEAWQATRQAVAEGRSTELLRMLMRSQEPLAVRLRERVSDQATALEQLARSLQPPRLVLAMAEGSRQPCSIYIRGNHNNRGEAVPPRNLEALGGAPGDRLQLAQEIASLENPLTARVIVNRLWHHLFGRGIVASVDDFGPQGTPPSHPQLLDHLAWEFAQEGWSIKRMIRRLVLSRTYAQSSTAATQADRSRIARVDPNNLLLHRMNLRRLPAEAIRDAILHNAGSLAAQPFGPEIPTHRTPFMTGRGARPSGPLDGQGRRTIYQAVYRNFLNPFLTTFDMPNPFGPKGRRSQSNVPAQSLALMNDPFVIDQARRWAEHVVAEGGKTDERIRRMVLRAHGRPPSEDQVRRLRVFLDDQQRRRGGDDLGAWQDLAHALWNMKAFVFLR